MSRAASASTSTAASAAVLLGCLAVVVAPAYAQAPAQQTVLADAWVDHIVEQHDQVDTMVRYLAAPSLTLIGGFLLATPAWAGWSLAAEVAWMTAGATMITSAVGTWATPDPWDAQLWYGRSASLGYTALGVGLAALCLDESSDCYDAPVTRHMGTAIGVINAGMFLTAFALWTFAPPPSPYALQRAVRGAPPEDRDAHVFRYLQERERRQRLGSYLALPWGIALGASFLVFAGDAASSGGRAVMYGLGGLMLGLVGGLTLYDLLRTPDSERFAAGRLPDD